MPTLFTRIVNGEIPSYQLGETDDYYAFLDIRPMTKGHALAIPKREVDYIFDLTDAELSGLMVFAKRVARALEAEVDCRRIGVAVVGLEVPHTHVHLMPINSIGDLGFGRPPVEMSEAEMTDLAARVRRRFAAAD
jgi:histidine triad (HIT) family protein